MPFDRLQRRDFLTLLGGAAAWPLAGRAQQQRVRRIAALMNLTADNPESPVRVAAFAQGLQELGWTIGRNVQIDTRWGAGDTDLYRRYAEELVALAPDVVVGFGASIVGALQRASRTVPIVFVSVVDPIGAGLIATLARPGSNATGFTAFEYGISGKWLELLKEITPGVKRVAVLRDPGTSAGIGQFAAIQSAAPSLGVELEPIDVRDGGEIARAVTAFARGSNRALIVPASAGASIHRGLIITMATQHRLPATYSDRALVAAGGLISYGPDRIDQFRRAAGYVDRILRGEKPADLPVQAPTKYELVVNLKTAKAMGLELPTSVLARADEVIE
jgi:putative ABC transport system substrate-binding protein